MVLNLVNRWIRSALDWKVEESIRGALQLLGPFPATGATGEGIVENVSWWMRLNHTHGLNIPGDLRRGWCGVRLGGGRSRCKGKGS